jgi:ribose transport system ATP-binding protein
MKDGKVVAERDPRQVTTAELHSLMVGRGSSDEFYRESSQLDIVDGPPVLEVSNLTLRGSFSSITLQVQPGEVLGIAGVQGSGREDLTRVIFGAEQHQTGELVVRGRKVRFASPAAAVRAGIGYIPAERKIEGIAQGMSVEENILLADPAPVSVGPFRKPRASRTTAEEWIDRLRVKTPGPGADVGNLSGGNQQKVALAKWLNSPRLKILILDHPTRGLDVGAKEDVYTLIRELCAKGIAVILLGDTLEEIIALSHRIAVMKDGEISAWFDAPRGNKPAPVDLVEWMV